jgi:hypothetical protein
MKAAKQPKPWVRNEFSIKPCKGVTAACFALTGLDSLFHPAPRAFALGWAISRFQRFESQHLKKPGGLTRKPMGIIVALEGTYDFQAQVPHFNGQIGFFGGSSLRIFQNSGKYRCNQWAPHRIPSSLLDIHGSLRHGMHNVPQFFREA